MHLIHPPELKSKLDAGEPVTVLDVREPWEYEVCHIDGSTHIPMGQIPNAAVSLDKSNEIVVLCHHGVRSLQVASFLEQTGFHHVANLEGGIDAWSREVDPDITQY
jgi:rhodanese-related sulfurtransferase